MNGVAGTAGCAGTILYVPEFDLIAIPVITSLLLIILTRKRHPLPTIRRRCPP